MSHAVPTVLIVDDIPSARKTLEMLLKTEGYRLEFAASGAEALACAPRIKPDLILLDIMMPEMDGYEVCRRIRSMPEISDVPIIMVTALDDRASRLRGLDLGADDFISKPIDWAELRARTRTIIRLNRHRTLSAERRRYELLIRESSPLRRQASRVFAGNGAGPVFRFLCPGDLRSAPRGAAGNLVAERGGCPAGGGGDLPGTS